MASGCTPAVKTEKRSAYPFPSTLYMRNKVAVISYSGYARDVPALALRLKGRLLLPTIQTKSVPDAVHMKVVNSSPGQSELCLSVDSNTTRTWWTYWITSTTYVKLKDA